jgi:hypothetical protein
MEIKFDNKICDKADLIRSLFTHQVYFRDCHICNIVDIAMSVNAVQKLKNHCGANDTHFP